MQIFVLLIHQKRHPRPGRKFVISVIRQTVGYAPYERRIMELLRLGYDKTALKFSKKRVLLLYYICLLFFFLKKKYW